VRLFHSSSISFNRKAERFFYHFVDMTTGARAFTSEVSSIDTAILLCGVLTSREYFSQDAQIQNLATQIYANVNFAWMLNGGTTLSMGWTPENGFLPTVGIPTAS